MDARGTRVNTAGRLRLIGGVFFAGLLLGVVAQLLRQVEGAAMSLGASTALWFTIGFVLAVWATRPAGPPVASSTLGIAIVASYLFGWLLAYHTLFAVRESVSFAAGWREVAPWLVTAIPVCLILGPLAGRSHERSILGDVFVALPIAWSLPEIVDALGQGHSHILLVAIPSGLVALLPAVISSRSGAGNVRVLVAAVVLGVVALVLWPVLRGYIPN